ncbi:unnamed protein product [Linum trigynum]|uniref:Uncharacterized protein n=1 Tax=Linum trigynum TaxID=586398 RepID=A0AAV2CGN6_9ROSI
MLLVLADLYFFEVCAGGCITRSNLAPLVPLDGNLNRTFGLLDRERELAESRRRIEERGQRQVGLEVEVEEEVVVVKEVETTEEEESEAEMAENQNGQEAN